MTEYSPYLSREDAIEEYKSLRAEILESQKQRVTLLQVSLGVVGALFTYFIRDNSITSLEALLLTVLAAATNLFTYSTRVRERRIANFLATFLRRVSPWSNLSSSEVRLTFFQRSSTAMVLALMVLSAALVIISFPGWPRSNTKIDIVWIIALAFSVLNVSVLVMIAKLPDFKPAFQQALTSYIESSLLAEAQRVKATETVPKKS